MDVVTYGRSVPESYVESAKQEVRLLPGCASGHWALHIEAVALAPDLAIWLTAPDRKVTTLTRSNVTTFPKEIFISF